MSKVEVEKLASNEDKKSLYGTCHTIFYVRVCRKFSYFLFTCCSGVFEQVYNYFQILWVKEDYYTFEVMEFFHFRSYCNELTKHERLKKVIT